MTKHIVVGLLAGVPSKVQCTVCKGNHAYKAFTPAKAPKKPRAAQPSPEMQDWKAASPLWDENKAIPYSMAGTFKRGDILKHSAFGLGLVRKVMDTKRMHVLFEVGEKLMVCGN